MPYIPQTQKEPMRQTIDPHVQGTRHAITDAACDPRVRHTGLFLAYRFLLESIVSSIERSAPKGAPVHGLRYRYHLNPIMGDLAGAIAEFAGRTQRSTDPSRRTIATFMKADAYTDAPHLRRECELLAEELMKEGIGGIIARLNYSISELACYAVSDGVLTIAQAHASLIAAFRWFYATYARPYEEYAIGFYGETEGYRAIGVGRKS